MNVISAIFTVSSSSLGQCPSDGLPEFAFIGRSNVGKSSLINMLTDSPSLAKVSSTPGKRGSSTIFWSTEAGIWSICRDTAMPAYRKASGANSRS